MNIKKEIKDIFIYHYKDMLQQKAVSKNKENLENICS